MVILNKFQIFEQQAKQPDVPRKFQYKLLQLFELKRVDSIYQGSWLYERTIQASGITKNNTDIYNSAIKL